MCLTTSAWGEGRGGDAVAAVLPVNNLRGNPGRHTTRDLGPKLRCAAGACRPEQPLRTLCPAALWTELLHAVRRRWRPGGWAHSAGARRARQHNQGGSGAAGQRALKDCIAILKARAAPDHPAPPGGLLAVRERAHRPQVRATARRGAAHSAPHEHQQQPAAQTSSKPTHQRSLGVERSTGFHHKRAGQRQHHPHHRHPPAGAGRGGAGHSGAEAWGRRAAAAAAPPRKQGTVTVGAIFMHPFPPSPDQLAPKEVALQQALIDERDAQQQGGGGAGDKRREPRHVAAAAGGSGGAAGEARSVPGGRMARQWAVQRCRKQKQTVAPQHGPPPA